MRLNFLVAELVEHGQEVLDVLEGVVRAIEVAANSVTVGVRCDGGDRADYAINLLVDKLFVLVNILTGEGGVGLWVESRVGGHRGHEDAHRVGIVAEGLHHGAQVLVQVGVLHYLLFPGNILINRRKVAFDQQVGNFQEVRLLCELLDGDAAVL